MNPTNRRLLSMHAYMREASAIGAPSYYEEKASAAYATPTSFDTNIVIITAALLVVLICALGMNIVIRCALRFTRRLTLEGPQAEAALGRANTHGINKQELKLLPTAIFHKEHIQKHSTGSLETSNNGSILNNKIDGGDDECSSSCCCYVQDFQCPICLCNFQDGEKIRVLPMCRHRFHVKCVDAWLSNHSSCPICRGDLGASLHDMQLPFHHHALNKTNLRPKLKPSSGGGSSEAVELQIVISPSGTLTPTLCRVLPPSTSSLPPSALPVPPLPPLTDGGPNSSARTH